MCSFGPTSPFESFLGRHLAFSGRTGSELGGGERRKDAPGRSCPGARVEGSASGTTPGVQAAFLCSRRESLDVCKFKVMPAAHQGRAWALHLSFLHRLPPSPGVLPLLPPWLSLPFSPFGSVRSDASCWSSVSCCLRRPSLPTTLKSDPSGNHFCSHSVWKSQSAPLFRKIQI